ncbi:MAG TPA: zinc-finger domain-containing protein [Thiothrix sp.]|nr:zinc-finger domain-containing protein [Thiothrix sp.]
MHVTVSRADLPLFCPSKQSSLWCAHPKVYLPIEEAENGEARCPYCGTVYQLVD